MDLQGIIPGAFEQKNIIYLIKIHLAGAIKCIKPMCLNFLDAPSFFISLSCPTFF